MLWLACLSVSSAAQRPQALRAQKVVKPVHWQTL